jgi:hypothetical protein
MFSDVFREKKASRLFLPTPNPAKEVGGGCPTSTNRETVVKEYSLEPDRSGVSTIPLINLLPLCRLRPSSSINANSLVQV